MSLILQTRWSRGQCAVCECEEDRVDQTWARPRPLRGLVLAIVTRVMGSAGACLRPACHDRLPCGRVRDGRGPVVTRPRQQPEMKLRRVVIEEVNVVYW